MIGKFYLTIGKCRRRLPFKSIVDLTNQILNGRILGNIKININRCTIVVCPLNTNPVGCRTTFNLT